MLGRALSVMGNVGSIGSGDKIRCSRNCGAPPRWGGGGGREACLSPHTGPGACSHPGHPGPELPASSADIVPAPTDLRAHWGRQATNTQTHKHGYNRDKCCEANKGTTEIEDREERLKKISL